VEVPIVAIATNIKDALNASGVEGVIVAGQLVDATGPARHVAPKADGTGNQFEPFDSWEVRVFTGGAVVEVSYRSAEARDAAVGDVHEKDFVALVATVTARAGRVYYRGA
jgi:hypothetical protein